MKIKYIIISICLTFSLVSCVSDDSENFIGLIDPEVSFAGTFVQEDQIGRPGINTVFSANEALENSFNVTIPSQLVSNFQQPFEDRLVGLHAAFGATYENNILGLDITTLTTVLAADVLQVAPDAPTSYFDGTNVLTGRALNDDVIDISLILLFGGNNGARFDGNNGTPSLVSDGVAGNDANFSNTFPYLSNPF